MKKIDICPALLDTNIVDGITPEILHEFVQISNSTIVQYIEHFMDKNRQNSDPDIQRVIEKLRVAYNSYYEYQSFVNSADLAEAFRLIVTQDRATISFDMDKKDLIKIRDTCRRVLSYEDKLRRYDADTFNKHLDKMSALASVSSDSNVVKCTTTLVKNAKERKRMFINVSGREDDRSVLYRIFKFKDKAIQLANTADACLSKMDTPANEEVRFDKRMWRHI